jgi:tetratricopeptide (TPR) repeat protein
MDAIDAAEPRYDLGVLFVHGIGQSAQGETLLRFGEPLRASIEKLAEPAPKQPAATEPAAASVSVVAAWLSDPGAGDPARAELDISGYQQAEAENAPGVAAATRSRWLMAEAWWAAKFPTPTYAEIASWSFGVLPATLIAHFDRRFRRVGFHAVRIYSRVASVEEIVFALGRLTLEGVVGVAALAFTPLLLVGVGLVLLLGLIPATRALAGALQRKISATVGDSYVFMHQAVTAATISTSVLERLEWLATRCRRVVVVAHSQGAAVAHRVLRARVTAPCDVLITFGSGLAKLSEIARGDITSGRAKLWVAALGGVIAAGGVVTALVQGWAEVPGPRGLLLGAMRPFLIVEIGVIAVFGWMVRLASVARGGANVSDGNEEAAAQLSLLRPASFLVLAGLLLIGPEVFADSTFNWAIVATAVTPALVVALGLALVFEGLIAWHGASRRFIDPQRQWLRDRELFRDEFELSNRRLNWYDLFASADPVPNGALLDDFEPEKLVSIEVCNRHSLLLDHTSYWQSKDEFLQRVTRLLLRQARIRTRTLNPDRAERRRRWRVQWLAVSRWIVGIAALVLAAQWMSGAPPLIDDSYRILVKPPGADDSWLKSALSSVGRSTAPLLAAALVWLAFLMATRGAWGMWESAEFDDFYRARDYRLGVRGFGLTLLAPIALSACAAYAVGGMPGLLVVASIVLALVLSARLWRRFGDRLRLRSASGSRADFDDLAKASLKRAFEAAVRRRDARALISIAAQLQGLDDALAERALVFAAFDLKNANAALALGRLREPTASIDDDARTAARRRAIDAYKQGAELGDPISARRAAYSLERVDDKAEAQTFYQRAFDLGDADAAHSLGLLMVKDGRDDPALREKALRIYEAGVSRGDALSASFLAGSYESKADAAKGEEARAHQRRAVELYRVAFNRGHVVAALRAGNLLRRMGDIEGARREYTLGMRLRDATAAAALGELEQESEQNEEAARQAYREAIRLDEKGSDAAAALVGLGVILEKQGRPVAAIPRYDAALWMPNGLHHSADAGLALARLLEATSMWSEQARIETALLRAAELAPWKAGDAYVEFLSRIYDSETAAEVSDQHIAGLSAQGLMTLSRLLYSDARRSQALLERAFALGPDSRGADEVAAELYLRRIGIDAAADERTLEQILSRGAYFAGKVATALEKRNWKTLADRIRKRMDASDEPQGHSVAPMPESKAT